MKKYLIIAIIVLASVLRLYRINSVPPALYWDEASLGYNAFSILTTGHDEHGKMLPITNFGAFGDYKPPGYIYTAVPSIALFGLNEFAIRFPSALFGIFTVFLTYLLARKIFQNEAIALISALFLAISPWHLQFSRGAFEANVALFFSTLGIYLFIKFEKDNALFIFPSLIAFVLAMYTFTGQRLFIPFILIILAIQFRERIKQKLKHVLIASTISFLLFLPLLNFVLFTQEGKLRFNEVTIFKDLAPINDSIRYRQQDHFSLLSSVIHNRRLFFAQDYLMHYFDAFNPSFLFSHGDVNPRLSIQTVGELYYFDLFFILAGLYFIVSKRQKYRFLILGWLLVSPLGPATARETPHALRMIHILPTFQLISTYGLFELYRLIPKKYFKISITIIFISMLFNIFYYLHNYYIHWPRDYSGEWQYGYKQAVQKVSQQYNSLDHILVTKYLGRPYIYFLLYGKVIPTQYLQTASIVRDNFLFYEVNSFDKFIFTNDLSVGTGLKGNILYISPKNGLPTGIDKLETIKDLSGESVFDIGERQQ